MGMHRASLYLVHVAFQGKMSRQILHFLFHYITPDLARLISQIASPLGTNFRRPIRVDCSKMLASCIEHLDLRRLAFMKVVHVVLSTFGTYIDLPAMEFSPGAGEFAFIS